VELTFQQGFWMRLKNHLLARIKATQAEVDPLTSTHAEITSPNSTAELDRLYFKKECMYKHNVMRINYTTYDVRRGQDTINPNTEHRDVMLLSPEDAEEPCHQYAYARVIGIYHVNAIYAGPGVSDYRARRMEFLWVRWFVHTTDEPVQRGWVDQRLDCLKLLPVHHEKAFGFVDPANVLRGCHLIPRFVKGKQHVDGKGISLCAQDSKDWRQYLAGQ
jgi:hypothetical protein